MRATFRYNLTAVYWGSDIGFHRRDALVFLFVKLFTFFIFFPPILCGLSLLGILWFSPVHAKPDRDIIRA
jgi:hypothetical protein